MKRLVDYERDRMYTQLDLILRNMQVPDILEDMTAGKGIDVCFSDFVSDLRVARGERFSNRLPMIRQIAEVLRLPLSV